MHDIPHISVCGGETQLFAPKYKRDKPPKKECGDSHSAGPSMHYFKP